MRRIITICHASGTGRFIMSHPYPPQHIAGKQKEEASCRQQSIPPFAPIQEKKKGIVLDAGVGNENGSEQQHPFSVNIHRIFAIFPGPVREDIHEFQPFQCKKTDCRINQKNTGKESGAARQHKEDDKNLGKAPIHPAGRQAVGKHYHGLQHSADAGELNPLSQHLQDQAAGTYHNAIENTVPDDGSKGIEAPGKSFCQTEFHQCNAEAEQHFIVAVAFNRVKTLKHKVYPYKYIEGDKELTDAGKKKRGLILHGAFQLNQEILLIKMEAAAFCRRFLVSVDKHS